jgi:hypothetical protein
VPRGPSGHAGTPRVVTRAPGDSCPPQPPSAVRSPIFTLQPSAVEMSDTRRLRQVGDSGSTNTPSPGDDIPNSTARSQPVTRWLWGTVPVMQWLSPAACSTAGPDKGGCVLGRPVRTAQLRPRRLKQDGLGVPGRVHGVQPFRDHLAQPVRHLGPTQCGGDVRAIEVAAGLPKREEVLLGDQGRPSPRWYRLAPRPCGTCEPNAAAASALVPGGRR